MTNEELIKYKERIEKLDPPKESDTWVVWIFSKEAAEALGVEWEK